MPTPSALLRLALVLLTALPCWARAEGPADVRALLAAGRPAEALAVAERVARANPKDPQGLFLQGVALMELRSDDAALAAFTQVAQEFPGLPEPYNNLALLHARSGRLEQALRALETALRNDPGHREARLNLGQVHLMLAVRAWEQAVAAGPGDVALQRQLDGARALLAPGAAPPR